MPISIGNITSQEEAIPESQPYKFVGQHGVMTDPNGFYYMRARYYDPEVGRFISEDPIGFEGGDTNLYAYVGNNPATLIDPNGQLAFFWHAGITFVAAMNSGQGIWDSAKMAWNVMAEDRNSTNPAAYAANIHAMIGQLPSGEYQTIDQARTVTNSIMQTVLFPLLCMRTRFVRHNFESMEQFGWNWSSVKHIMKDVFRVQVQYPMHIKHDEYV